MVPAQMSTSTEPKAFWLNTLASCRPTTSAMPIQVATIASSVIRPGNRRLIALLAITTSAG